MHKAQKNPPLSLLLSLGSLFFGVLALVMTYQIDGRIFLASRKIDRPHQSLSHSAPSPPQDAEAEALDLTLDCPNDDLLTEACIETSPFEARSLSLLEKHFFLSLKPSYEASISAAKQTRLGEF